VTTDIKVSAPALSIGDTREVMLPVLRDIMTAIGVLVHQADGATLATLHDMITRTLELQHRDKPRVVDNHTSALLELSNCLIDEANRRRVREARDRNGLSVSDLMERLTGCWLGLYFLGVPFPQPWEAVLFFVQRLGFPRGASASKAIGDLYRERRLRFEQDRMLFEGIHVLDLNPLTVADGVAVPDAPPSSDLSSAIARLGRYYEFLQLRLYVRSRAPMCYSVPHTVVRNILLSEPERAQRINEMWILLNACFNCGEKEEAYPSAELRIVRSNSIDSLPACVLGPRSGIYRTRGQAADGVEPPGNFLPQELLENYRLRLSSVHHEATVVPKSSRQSFEDVCADLLKP
jgi:hypothetical protein